MNKNYNLVIKNKQIQTYLYLNIHNCKYDKKYYKK